MTRYPVIEPYASGMLDVGDANQVYWETCGNPDGKSAVVLHGGPGSGCTPYHRRLFDPERYRIVLFDQRGCGRSTPHAADFDTDLSVNTTDHLISDIELLRSHFGIERWLVYGNSWGCTLGLAYAQRHTGVVSEIVLLAVGTSSRAEIDWLYHGAGASFPDAWKRFHDSVPEGARDGDLVEAYHGLLQDSDPDVREAAARNWCAWEDAVVATSPDSKPNPRYDDPRFRIAFARIVTHYFHHGAWLDDEQLLRNIGALDGIPAVLIHGRNDISTPMRTAERLAAAWASSELVIIDAGHLSSDAGMTEAVIASTDRFAHS